MSLVVGDEGHTYVQLRDQQRQLATFCGLVELGGDGDLALLGLGVGLQQLQLVVLDVGLGHVDEQHVAYDAAVVPPVEDLRGHGLGLALVVDLDDDHVLAVAQLVGDVSIESCETSDVGAHLSAVDVRHPDFR